MTTVLVTGATGFVGRFLCDRLCMANVRVRGTLLPFESETALHGSVEPVRVEPLGPATPWLHAVSGVDTVIHLAARVHVMREFASDPLKEFRTVNTAGSEQLALEAADAGVRRLVFMSTIGVNGDNSGEKPFSETDDPSPHNPYSVSKYEAELSLQRIARQTGLEIVIVRAPLVYGPGNPGNFHSLLRGVTSGIPLPFASVVNSRSLVYVGNLVDALTLCAFHSRAAGNRYLLSDGEDMSTPELIRRTASALGIKSHLFPFPPKLMMAAGAALGKTATVNSLIASLAVDSSKIRRELGWHPPFSVDQGLKNTANWFLEQR